MSLAFGVPVRSLQQILTAREFAEYYAFLRMEPRGDQRADWHAAQICQTIAGVMGGKGKLREFVLDFSPRTKPTADEIGRKLAVFFGLHNDTVRRSRKGKE